MVGFKNNVLETDNISFDNGITQILTDGQLIIGDSTGNPKISTLTAGANVTITNSHGNITIASTGGGTSLSPYIVGPTNSDFTTIQAAITAAIAAGASDSNPINIYIKPGTYTENLTSQPGIRLIGLGAGASSSSNDFPPLSVIWDGTCTLSSGTMVFESIRIAYSGSAICISSGGNLKFTYCHFYGSTGTYITTTADGKSLEFETCFLNTGTFFSSTHWVDMRFQNSYLAGSFTIGGVGNQLIIEKSTIMSGFTLSSGSNGSFIFQWCDILSPILVDTSASTTAGISCELNFCKAYSTSTALLKVNKASASVNNCTINGNTYFIDDTVGTGSNSYQIRNSTVSNSQAVNLGDNSNVYFYNCNLQGFGTPTLGTGANVHYVDSLSGNGNTVINSDQLSTSATDGFLQIPSCNGAPTGTPTSYGSAVPMIYDSTNDIPWFYNGSWHGGGGSGITTLDGDSGSATGSTINIIATPTCGSSVSFDGSSGTLTLNASDANDNTFWGLSAGSATAVNGPGNSGFGKQALQSLNGSVSTGNNNSAFGYASLALCDVGTGNSGFGYTTLVNCTGSSNTAIGTAAGATISTGNLNTIVGNNAFNSGTLTGSYNIGIGQNAGQNYTSSEGSNILIGSEGAAAESHTLRIGTQGSGNGQVNRAFVAGIVGVTTSNTQMVTIDSTTGQLGAATVPSGGGFTWNTVSGTSQSAAVNNGYITNNASLVTVTLPSTASVGDIVEIAGKGAGGWKVAQNSGQVIHMDGVDSTIGTGGSLASTVRYDAVRLLCITSNTDWLVLSGIGNLTVV